VVGYSEFKRKENGVSGPCLGPNNPLIISCFNPPWEGNQDSILVYLKFCGNLVDKCTIFRFLHFRYNFVVLLSGQKQPTHQLYSHFNITNFINEFISWFHR